jgi:hypothetical protein
MPRLSKGGVPWMAPFPAMMIHANLHWPEMKDKALWPMALAHAAFVYNNTPNSSSGIVPIEIFSRTHSDGQVIRNLHTWGRPAYVLEPKLTQAGGKIPKWNPFLPWTIHGYLSCSC